MNPLPPPAAFNKRDLPPPQHPHPPPQNIALLTRLVTLAANLAPESACHYERGSQGSAHPRDKHARVVITVPGEIRRVEIKLRRRAVIKQ